MFNLIRMQVCVCCKTCFVDIDKFVSLSKDCFSCMHGNWRRLCIAASICKEDSIETLLKTWINSVPVHSIASLVTPPDWQFAQLIHVLLVRLALNDHPHGETFVSRFCRILSIVFIQILFQVLTSFLPKFIQVPSDPSPVW